MLPYPSGEWQPVQCCTVLQVQPCQAVNIAHDEADIRLYNIANVVLQDEGLSDESR
jgi:hypothetical protein